MNIFRLGQESRVPKRNTKKHAGNIQTSHTGCNAGFKPPTKPTDLIQYIPFFKVQPTLIYKFKIQRYLHIAFTVIK